MDVREFVRQRVGGRCEYCLLPDEFDELPFHVEHVIARQHGGSEQVENLCWSCSRCNLQKGPNVASLDVNSQALTGLYNPRTQNWSEHFLLRDGRIIGVTAVGRVTVRLLRMNEVHRADLRRNLVDRGII